MRLVSFEDGFGRIEGDTIIPMGPSLLEHLAGGGASDGIPRPLAEAPLLAPIPNPGKVICVGLNYKDHAAESGMDLPEVPILFAKFSNSVAAPGADVRPPTGVDQIDYEAELAVIIGRRTSRVSVDDALSHVAGYACCNDVSARGLQFRTSQWMYGKAIDTFLPLGPWLVTPDEVPDPQALGIRCLVNGEVRQSSSTSEMVFGVADLISFISHTLTLAPGDVIATGTPAGVGMARKPPEYMRDGDVMQVEIDGLGTLNNPVRWET
jgi:2-keto-4-pentenoate hydratase/2-oxohepta-3-ene-1,7-dioic acid hydratase in catechol pathway